ncbi:MAG: hypothetical protein ACOVLC_01255 [Flavobacterium sp.]
MNHASFTIEKKVLEDVLKKITRVIGRQTKFNINTILELTITDQLLTFVIPGIKIEQPCETVLTAKISLGFFYFKDLINSCKNITVVCNFYDQEMHFDRMKIAVQTTFFETDAILRSINLPVNYTHFHLLRLEHEGFTDEEVRFNGLSYELESAKKHVKVNIQNAIQFLGVYGITSKELEDLIQKKIRLKES